MNDDLVRLLKYELGDSPSRKRPKGNSALHDQPLLVVQDDLQALDLVAIHGPDPAQEGGALIELKLRCIGTGTTRRARLSENRRDDFTPLDRHRRGKRPTQPRRREVLAMRQRSGVKEIVAYQPLRNPLTRLSEPRPMRP
jgi:hypothetical protein